MDARLQRRVQRYGWDKAAGFYERFWARQILPAQERLLVMADLQRGERVIDIACGTGLVTFRAAEAVGADGQVMGNDISGTMVDRAREEGEQHELGSVSFERMDAEALDVQDASFDVALDALGLMYVPDPMAAIKEMHRVVKPGGRAVAAVWGARNRCGWAEIFPIVDARVRSEVCPMFFQLGTLDALQRDFETAGFCDVATERLSTVLRYESGEDACGAAFAGGPVALAHSRFDDETCHETRAEYLASIESFRNGDSYEIPGEFVVVSGRKP